MKLKRYAETHVEVEIHQEEKQKLYLNSNEDNTKTSLTRDAASMLNLLTSELVLVYDKPEYKNMIKINCFFIKGKQYTG